MHDVTRMILHVMYQISSVSASHKDEIGITYVLRQMSVATHITYYICVATDMGWLRLVGSLKLQVFFAEYSLFYRALLQKRPIILRSVLIGGTAYHECLSTQSFVEYGI